MGRLVSVGGLVALGLVGCPACRWFARNPSTAGELRIGADHAPPYYSHLPGGRVEGLTVDVMNAAAARAGIQLRWVPWTGLIDDAFNSHAVDLWPGVSPNARRRQFAQFTEPWLTNGFVLVSLKDSPPRVAAGWNGEKIAIRDGPFLESAARSRFPSSPLYRASSREGALQAVCRGEAAAALTELRFLDVAILDRPAGCETTRLRLQPLAGLTSRLSIMSTPAAAPAAQRIREQIDRLAADGTFADILEHWSAFSSVDAHSIEELKGAETRNRIYAGALLAGLLTLAAVVFLYLRANAANRRAGEARAIAETASAAKTDFLAKMSHEIRTPLNGVIGMTDLMLAGTLPAPVRRDLEIVKASADELLDILSTILDLSRIEAGRLPVETAPFDLARLLDDVLRTFGARAAEKGISASIHIAPGVHRWYSSDPVRIRQILLNYVSNALKFTDHGSIRIAVSPADASRLRIAVEDTGIGIPPDKQERLFHEFSQVDGSMTRRYSGSGLGLAIARQLADLLGGSTGYEPNSPQGSVFWVELPLIPVPPPAPSAAPAPAPAGAPRFEGARVLLAEDNSVNRLLATRLLTGAGCTVDAAVNGREAVQLAGAQKYDLILMDCQMPELDGYEATAQLRRGGNRTPIVALTAHALAGDRDRCFAAGMDGYLTKPLDASGLLAALSKHLASHPG